MYDMMSILHTYDMIRILYKTCTKTKIRRLASHLELHKKDFSSLRGLRRLLGKRRRLLAYLAKKNRVRYKKLIGQLNIREQ